MIEGRIRFIQDGEVVAEGCNLITNIGKRAILRYLAGQVDNYASGLVVGVSSTTPNATDTALSFEVSRMPIMISSVKDYVNFDIVYRAQLPKGLQASIREVGLVSNVTSSSTRGLFNRVLSQMDSSGEGWTALSGPAISSDTANSRFGQDGLRVNTIPLSTTSLLELPVALDMSGYVQTDQIRLLYTTFDTNCQEIKVEFLASNGKSLYTLITPPTHTAGAGNPQVNIASVPITSFVNWANDWNDVVDIRVTTTAKSAGACSIMFDGLIIVDNNTIDENSCLVTRAAVGPVTKSSNVDMDIEYTLRFAL